MRRLAVAAELNYGSFAEVRSGGRDSGLHVIALGPHFQPVVWRSADRNARLALAIGFNVGAAVQDGTTSSESSVTGGFNFGLLGNYFPPPQLRPRPGGRDPHPDREPRGRPRDRRRGLRCAQPHLRRREVSEPADYYYY